MEAFPDPVDTGRPYGEHHRLAPLVAFQLPWEGIRVARNIAAVVDQAELDIETLAVAGAVVEETEVVVVVVDSVEFAVQDILQVALPASTVVPWDVPSVVPVWEVLQRLVAAGGHQMASAAWAAYRVDWAVMAAGARWEGQSFASVVYLLPQAGDHFATALETEVRAEMLPAWVRVLLPMGDVQPFVDWGTVAHLHWTLEVRQSTCFEIDWVNFAELH